jgi:hypothetical protein
MTQAATVNDFTRHSYAPILEPPPVCFKGSQCVKFKVGQYAFAGEVAEWLKAHAWKACLGETLTWVRIPPSPPLNPVVEDLHISLTTYKD